MKNFKRIFAIIGVILLLALPVILILSAFFATKESHSFFVASLFSIIVLPILLYGYIMIYKIIHKDKNNKQNDDNSTEE